MQQTSSKGKQEQRRLGGFTENCARNCNSTLLANGQCTSLKLSKKIKCRILWDFVIQTDHQNQVKRSDQVLTNKKKRNCDLVDLIASADNRVKKKESEKFNKYEDLVRELKKLWNIEGNNDTICDWGFYNNPREPARLLRTLLYTLWS